MTQLNMSKAWANCRKDLAVVHCRNDFDKALKIFKRSMGVSGIFKELKFRKKFVKRSARLREKRRKAESRLRRMLN